MTQEGLAVEPIVLVVRAAERSAKKDLTQYLTGEQMVENDYPVPSYLADVFSKLDGWMETLEADPQSVHAIDYETVRTLSCVLSIVY